MNHKSNPAAVPPISKLEHLKEIWEQLLPHRLLELSEALIQVAPLGADSSARYPGSEMSDGERAIFYFIGQSLMAPDNAAIIVDEPESHVHRAILRPLWNAIEKARPDCGFVYITHDLDFAVGRSASAKYYIRGYQHNPPQWDLHDLPEDTGLPADVVAELVGSRRPILFVEGQRGSLDLTIYGSHYVNFTIIPIGSCEHVIHSVSSYKNSALLHQHVVRGLVDADDRTTEELAHLVARDIYSLPVAEIENLFALPNIFSALAEAFMCADPKKALNDLTDDVMREIQANIDGVCARHTIRQVDRRLKLIELEGKDSQTLEATLKARLATVDTSAIFNSFKSRLQACVDVKDLAGAMRLYDNKGIIGIVARALGLKGSKALLEKVTRLLAEQEGERLRKEFTNTLPSIPL
jgi:hypothetical protein